MKLKIEHILLILIFILTLGFRLYFSLGNDIFNSDQAYHNFRTIQNIINEQGLPQYDPLSYGGRDVVYPSLFHILLAILSFGSITILKVLTEVMASSLVIIVYLVAKEVSDNNYSSLFSSLLSAFIPGLIIDTVNDLSVFSLALPIFFLLLYLFLKLENKKLLWIFIALIFLLAATDATVFIFVLTIMFYFLLISGGALNASRIEKEAAISSSLVIILISLIIYKKAFLVYGIKTIWHNAPANIVVDSFRNFSPLDLILNVGIISLLLGTIGLYLGIKRERKKIIYIFSAFMLCILFLLSFRLITLASGLIFFGIGFAIFSSLTMSHIYNFLERSKLGSTELVLTIIFIILFVAFSLIPSYNMINTIGKINQEKISDMISLRNNAEINATVLGSIREGNLITAIALRKNVLDSNFLLAPSPVERQNDAKLIYIGLSEAKALELTKKYKINIIYLSEDTKALYGITSLKYAEGGRCFIKEGNFYVVKC